MEPDNVAVVCAAIDPARVSERNATRKPRRRMRVMGLYLGYTANASISISQSALTSATTPTVDRAGLVGLAVVPNTSPYAALHPSMSIRLFFVGSGTRYARR